MVSGGVEDLFVTDQGKPPYRMEKGILKMKIRGVCVSEVPREGKKETKYGCYWKCNREGS